MAVKTMLSCPQSVKMSSICLIYLCFLIVSVNSFALNNAKYCRPISDRLSSFRCMKLASTRVAASVTKVTPTTGFDVDIEERTHECLDMQFVLDSLRNATVTVLGSQISSERMAIDCDSASMNYAMVDEISSVIDFIPLRTKMNVWPLLRVIELNSSPPEQEDLAAFSENIESIFEVKNFFEANMDKLGLFRDLIDTLVLPEVLVEVFKDAFDDDGNLNAEKYKELGKLRRQSASLRGRIIQIIETLLRSQDMKEKIADNGYTEMDGRYCLMLKNTYKKGVGIVHGSSNTGRTMYVEPMEVVEPTNEMKSIQGLIRAEENRILFEMCQTISQNRVEIKEAVTAIAEIDVFRAKAKVGQKLRGIIPEVGNEGSIRCVDARHPVLLLRGTEPIGNKIELNQSATALVISGPNAGGKTIVLKTAGLFALMAKHAIPLPTKMGARVDFMQVMADIGDMQSVSGDLSTFSGHLVVCREMLSHAQSYSGHSLVLLDEIGTGTDPAQGAALAQAVLEELINLGTRVIVTTHYQRIKELAAEDSRFQIAAMEFVDNRPTYRLRLGSVGESYALEAGRRMNLPENVLERANLLLDDESRRILALQKRLEEETDRARAKQKELDDAISALGEREDAIERSKSMLEEQIKKLREGKTDEFLVELHAKERELELLIRKAQEVAVQTDMSRMDVEKAIEKVKAEVKTTRIDTEKAIVEVSAEDLATPLIPGEPVEEGVTLIVLEKGSIFGSRGIVTQKNKGRGRVFLRVAGVEVKMERHLLGRPHRAGKMGFLTGDAEDENMSAKDRRMMKMLQEDLVDPDKLMVKPRKVKDGKLVGLRMATNTLDIRGHGLAEAQDLTMTYFERTMNKDLKDQLGIVYINHGNVKSSDAIKPKFRLWLKKNPLVRRLAPAELSDGGDAFTVVELDFAE